MGFRQADKRPISQWIFIPAITRVIDGSVMKVNIQIARILPTRKSFRSNYFLFNP
jgi:hypothetical protein